MDTPADREVFPGADFSAWLKPEHSAEFVAFWTTDAGRTMGAALIPFLDKQ